MACPQFTLHTDFASQWAYVAHLAIDEKGYDASEYDTKQVGLLQGENFAPAYVKINPNGTIPSLTSPSLTQPLTESADIAKYIDATRPNSPSLFPTDPTKLARVEELISHVHQDKLSTNLVLLQARGPEEWEANKAGSVETFLGNRQEKLITYGAANPDIPLYASRTPLNGHIYDLYRASKIGPEQEEFFTATEQGYKDYAAGLRELDSMLVLPFAAGETVTAADLHIVPWLAHAMWAAGGREVGDFEPLRARVKKSVPDFEFGENTRRWWANISARESFKKNYPKLH
ncbi:hypothetical protein VFPFJ_11673 [Purpureocillium lilacinum]|uniref:Glutathione S-transferase n=1 Tax=Purpureocillium lilacinum TaxID=33203 RepID=A0A179EYC7_PURLI|nr:hypothetical protein VFPFJ_11673 [Purpureocillium lilacinum]OAQ58178.1 hypothetical protein VFPFJ_11673 [Purpureocillium lilacinum]